MAYQALYRKYRPVTFSDVTGQDHITTTLKNQLASGKIFHAYLFTGTRGTGKTSCAKILAKAVNCLDAQNGDPCGKCAACLAISNGENTDVVEIDAASNNGVDDIRELRDQINFIPADSKYRVYIIDEVHMLTESAFNALLKTLEEPPAHVIFILATTEVHKLPATILSRCQRFDFKRIDTDCIIGRIDYIAQKEGLTVTKEAAGLIAAAADGGMRDALSILDLCVSSNKDIDENTVITCCGMAGKDYLFKLADAIKKKNTEDALIVLDKLYSNSVDMLRLLNELITHYRNLMIVKTVKGEHQPIVCSAKEKQDYITQAKDYPLSSIMGVLSSLNTTLPLMQTGNRRLQMEMVLIRLCSDNQMGDALSLEQRISALESALKNGSFAVNKPEQVIPSVPAFMQKKEPEKQPLSEDLPPIPKEPPAEPVNIPSVAPTPDIAPLQNGKCDKWNDILNIVAANCPPAIGILDGSSAYIENDLLLIDAPNPLFRNMMNTNASMRNAIKRAAEQVLNKSFRLGPYKKKEASENSDDPLKALADKLKELEVPGGNI